MTTPTLHISGIARPLYVLPPPASDHPTVFACSLAKAGSNLFFAILNDLCLNSSNLAYVDVTGGFWEHGIDPARQPKSAANLFEPKGYCYGGFRGFPLEYAVPHFAGMRKVLLVRDIRDMAVSNYFSTAFSHSLPGTTLDDKWRRAVEVFRARVQRMDLDRAVLFLARDYLKPWRVYKALLAKHRFRIWRYEDVIFRKREWIDELADYLGLEAKPASRDNLLRMVDVVPETENPSEFIRKVTPGDHKIKLRPRTIAKLDRMFGDYLDAFGYPRVRSWIFDRSGTPFDRGGAAMGFDSR